LQNTTIANIIKKGRKVREKARNIDKEKEIYLIFFQKA
jgi:hypothetical protein